MAKCYLMIEDTPGGLAFAVDFGQPPETLPEDVNELTEAQYTTHSFMAVLRGMGDPNELARQRAEARSQIVLPAHVADEVRGDGES